MAKRHIPEAHAAHPNVTPLIDVVMVLIVFFMLVAKIGVSTGADENIMVPETILGIEIQDMGNTLVLNVKPGLNDRPLVTAQIPNDQNEPIITELKVDIDPDKKTSQLINTLKFFRYGKDMVKGGPNADNDEFQVIIRGEKEMQYHYLQTVLTACAQAQVKTVNFNTAKKVVREEAASAN